MTVVTMVEPDERVLSAGTRVEVCSRFEERWTRGFTIAEVVEGGYRVRRLSDEQLLPRVFPAEDVRRERRRGQWWY